jgi:hypothetical protein
MLASVYQKEPLVGRYSLPPDVGIVLMRSLYNGTLALVKRVVVRFSHGRDYRV